MSETCAPAPGAGVDLLLDLAQSRLSVCPAKVRPDLAACLGYLRLARGAGTDPTAHLADVDRHYARAITLESKGLDHREDRALSLMVMAISSLRENSPSSNAQAERTLRLIRLTALD